jgi:hypothetical protein
LPNTQLLTVKLYTADREQNFVRKQRDVDMNPINASDTTVNCLGTELHIHTYIHTYILHTHIHTYIQVFMLFL